LNARKDNCSTEVYPEIFKALRKPKSDPEILKKREENNKRIITKEF